MSKSSIIWSVKELVSVLRKRQLNKFDVNIGVSGKRGVGKSTFLYKVFRSFKQDGFIQKKHQVYTRDDVMTLLSSQQFSYCWDDEAINSGYKRDFQNKGQQELIKIVTMFRDNYNIYGSALPFFYSLDKDLRELIFCHIHIIRRGVGVLFMQLKTSIHSADPWDTKRNIQIEIKENQRLMRNPNVPFRYDRFTTFAGYIYFGDMTAKQKLKYEKIKREKRKETIANLSVSVKEEKPLNIYDQIYKSLLEGKLTTKGIYLLCQVHNLKLTSLISSMNKKIKDDKIFNKSYSDFLDKEEKEKKVTLLNDLVPSFN